MTRLGKSGLITFLIVITMSAAGIYAYLNKSATTEEATSSAAQKSPPIPASTERSSAGASSQSRPDAVNLPSSAVDRVSSPPPRTYLNVESGLLNEMGGNQGMNVRVVTSLLKGDQFNQFMDQLTKEGGGSQLAQELTELYSRSAQEASTASGKTLDVKISCGTATCALVAGASTKEEFDEWFKFFAANPDAPPHAAGRYDKVLENGLTEYRVIFSSDPTRNSVIMRR